MSYLCSLLLITALQSACCRQSLSYPIFADIVRIEVTTKDNVAVKEIKDKADINSIARFIDQRRSRWCSPFSGIPEASANLVFHRAEGGHAEIGLGDGFLVVELAGGKYVLEISPEEQLEFFKLVNIDEASLFKR